MKNSRLFLISGFIATIILFSFTNKSGNTLTVKCIDANNNTGVVWVALYNSEGTYMKKQFMGNSSKIFNKTASVEFKNVPNGIYAVSCFHDENENQKLDTNALGIPKEQYGFSNNPNSMFGPPSFKKASFKLNSDKVIVIKF